MKLGAWIQKEITEGRASGLKDAYRQLSEQIEKKGGETVSAQTIENAAGGMLLKKYGKAKAISEATKGAVSISELCE